MDPLTSYLMESETNRQSSLSRMEKFASALARTDSPDPFDRALRRLNQAPAKPQQVKLALASCSGGKKKVIEKLKKRIDSKKTSSKLAEAKAYGAQMAERDLLRIQAMHDPQGAVQALQQSGSLRKVSTVQEEAILRQIGEMFRKRANPAIDGLFSAAPQVPGPAGAVTAPQTPPVTVGSLFNAPRPQQPQPQQQQQMNQRTLPSQPATTQPSRVGQMPSAPATPAVSPVVGR